MLQNILQNSAVTSTGQDNNSCVRQQDCYRGTKFKQHYVGIQH